VCVCTITVTFSEETPQKKRKSTEGRMTERRKTIKCGFFEDVSEQKARQTLKIMPLNIA
jgi:hypothetical protein